MKSLIPYKRQAAFVALIVFAFVVWIAVIVLGDKSYVDEGTHARQIQRFFKGNYSMLDDLTNIPGYHVTVATIEKIVHPNEKYPPLAESRSVSLALSATSLLLFYLISKKIGIGDPKMRTLQYAFFPITFLYFPLVYTDIFSLALLLAAFLPILYRKYTLSAVISLLCLAVRQDAIVWVGFFWLFAFVSEYGFVLSIRNISRHFRNTIGYVAVLILFLSFVLFNGGIAIGDKESHVVGLYSGGIYFFLATVGFLFLPTLVTFFKTADWNRLKGYLTYILPIGTVLGLSFVLFPPALHKYNLDAHFIRNLVLEQAYTRYWWLYAVSIVLGFSAIYVMKIQGRFIALLPIIDLSLIPSFLIEQRYFIVPLVFLLLFRTESTKHTERALTVFFLSLSLSLVYMLLRMDLFF